MAKSTSKIREHFQALTGNTEGGENVESEVSPSATTTAKPKSVKVIRDKGFAKRLNQAIDSIPGAPDAHGRQTWLKHRLEERFDVEFSKNNYSKWFNGETRPKRDTLKLVAEVLGVSPAWLSLGVDASVNIKDSRKHNALASGAVNIVAGLIQLSGGAISFPEHEEAEVDIFTIVNGKQMPISVRMVQRTRDGGLEFVLGRRHEQLFVIGVVPGEKFGEIKLLNLNGPEISLLSTNDKGIQILPVERQGDAVVAAGHTIPEITGFNGPAKTAKPKVAPSEILISPEAKRALDL